MMAMTPIKMICWRGVKVFSLDHAEQLTLICLATSEDQARWVAWSLGQAHHVEHKELDSDGLRVIA